MSSENGGQCLVSGYSFVQYHDMELLETGTPE